MTLAPVLFGALMDARQYAAVWLGIAGLLAVLIGTAVNVRRNAQPIAAAAAA